MVVLALEEQNVITIDLEEPEDIQLVLDPSINLFSSLGDVEFSGLISDQFAQFDGSKWKNVTISVSGDAWGDPVDANIIPDADGTRDLGSTSKRFDQTFTDFIDVTNDMILGGTINGITIITPGATTAAGIVLPEDTDNGTDTITLIAPASIVSNKTITFQDVTGTVFISGGIDVPVSDGGTGASTASDARVNLGLEIGVDVQAFDVELQAIAGLVSAADQLPFFTGSGTAALTTLTTAGRALIDDASASAQRTTLGLVIGTDVQAQDAELQAIADLVSAADRLPFFTGSGTAALTTLTSAGRALIDDADASAQRSTLGLVIGTDVQAFDDGLADIAGLATTDSNFIVGSGANWVAESGATVRVSLGLTIGTDVQAFDNDLTTLSTAFTTASASSAASLLLAEDTDNGVNTIQLIAPALITTNKVITFQDITGTVIVTGGLDLPVADGGTGASDASTARTNLGVAIGTDVQAFDDGLNDIAGLATTDSNFIVGSGANWVAESGSTVRVSLGLTIGTDVQAFSARLTDIAALAVTDNNFIVGNGATWVAESGTTVRASLGLTIGTDVQAFDDGLNDIAGLATTDNNFIVGSGANWVAESGVTARTSLGAQEDLSGATLTAATVATDDKILGQDTDDSDNLKTFTAQSIADLFDTAASETVSGIAELATLAEVNTGTDAVRIVTPDTLSGSYAGTKTATFYETDPTADLTTGDGKAFIHIPASLAGMNLVTVHAEVITAGTTGVLTIQIRNVTQAVDMLSTELTVDSGETGSDTAAIPAVIDTANDDVAINDVIAMDIDTVQTTAPKGLIVTLEFRLP